LFIALRPVEFIIAANFSLVFDGEKIWREKVELVLFDLFIFADKKYFIR